MSRIRLKLFASLIVLIFTMSLFPYVRVNADEIKSGTCGDALTWELDDEGVLTISGTGDMYNYSFGNDEDVPSWYDNCKLIMTVVISSDVTSIGDNAFNGCYNLKDITLPDSVTSIGEGAFMYCSGLSGITLPDSVTSIGDGAFSCCESLTSITIPDGVTTIGDSVFSECSSLTSITMPEDVTLIGDNAFDSCSSLTSISIPENVISIGAGAFSCCESLTSITLSENLTSIGDCAFEYCSSLTDITIPESVTSIGTYAFADCYSLTNITIPDSVTSIDEGAFIDCHCLTSITISGGVTSIGESAFFYCYNLTHIVIPDSVTSIGDDAFGYCSGLETVTIGERLFNSENCHDEYLKNLSSDILNLYHSVDFETGENGEVGIESRDYETGIVTLSVTPDPNYRVDKITVTGTDGTAELTPVNGVYSVDTSKGDVTVTPTFKTVAPVLYSGYCGDDLTWILDDEGVLTISGTGDMYDYDYYDEDAVAPWDDYKGLITSVVITSGVTSIGNRSFAFFENLASITIPDSVTSIGIGVFNYCVNLTDVTIPDSVTSIGAGAFAGCSGLAGITIPEGVTTIGDSTFGLCSSLTGIIIPQGVTSIGEIAFYGCSGLTSITIPDSVTSIGLNAFGDCSGLASVTISHRLLSSIKANSVGLRDTVTMNPYYSVDFVTGENGEVGIASRDYETGIVTLYVTPDSDYQVGEITVTDSNGMDKLFPENGVYFVDTSNGDVTVTTTFIDASIWQYGTFGDNDNLTWALDLEGVLTISGTGDMPDSDCSPWYDYRSSITSVVISSGVTSIGMYAFDSCENLTSVTIPDSVTRIDYSAFICCESLTDIVIPDSVASIDRYAFGSCSSLTNITIPEGVKSIEFYTFFGCTSLSIVNIPDSVTSIDEKAFGNCTSLETVSISKRLYNNKEANLDDTLNSLSSEILNLYNSVDFSTGNNGKVGIASRNYETGIVTLYVTPDSDYKVDKITVTDISGMEALTPVNGVYSVDTSDGDVTVTTTFKVSVLASGACGDELSCTLDDEGVLKISGTGDMYNFSNNVRAPWSEHIYDVKYVIISSGVTSIGSKAFDGCQFLKSIMIPEGVTSIGENAFYFCVSLEGVTIPNGVISIGNNAFDCCYNLASITIPDSVISIGNSAFSGCSVLTSITIPDSVISIGNYAFSGCGRLTKINIPDGVTSIGSNTFSGCSRLADVTIPDGVTSIGNSAFSDCSVLTIITIPDSVTSIGNSAFSCCTGLSNITLPDGLTSLGSLSFYGCKNLTSITIPDSVTSIGNSAFSCCTGLSNITLPDGLTSLGSWSFFGCNNLTSIIIPKGVTSIDECSFVDCSKLTCITIPDGVTSIDESAFYDCNNLTDVYYLGTSEQFESIGYTFDNRVVVHFATPLEILTQPEDFTGIIGSKATFSIEAKGDDLKYQWQMKSNGNWKNSAASGSKTSTITFNITSSHDGKQYRCVVTDRYGNEVLSDVVTVHVGTALKISEQPEDYTGPSGSKAVFGIEAEGEELTFQWQMLSNGNWKNSAASGSKTSSIKFNITGSHDGKQYRCVVTDRFGNKELSDVVTVHVGTALKITDQPEDFTGPIGSKATFRLEAEGEDIKYQWQMLSNDIWKNSAASGSKTSSIRFNISSSHDGKQYRCIVTDRFGNEAISDVVTLHLPTPLEITEQPSDFTGPAGSKATFSLEADGEDLSYQWQMLSNGTWKNSAASGSKTSTIKFNITGSHDGKQYRCIVKDRYGNEEISDVVTVYVGTLLEIVEQPADYSGPVGSKATLFVEAEGEDLTYLWQVNKNGEWKNTAASGANTSSITFKVTSSHDGMQYRCVVTDSDGNEVISDVVTVHVD